MCFFKLPQWSLRVRFKTLKHLRVGHGGGTQTCTQDRRMRGTTLKGFFKWHPVGGGGGARQWRVTTRITGVHWICPDWTGFPNLNVKWFYKKKYEQHNSSKFSSIVLPQPSSHWLRSCLPPAVAPLLHLASRGVLYPHCPPRPRRYIQPASLNACSYAEIQFIRLPPARPGHYPRSIHTFRI